MLFWLALLVILAIDCWVFLLFVRGARAEAHVPEAPENGDGFRWVFLVPALNEEVTIRDSVERLLAIPVARRTVMVIDDASDDGTTAILGAIGHADLQVVRRDLPNARCGKAAALNHAYRVLKHTLADVDTREVIVVIVDADGRLDGAAPRFAAAHFADPTVGGVQSLVRIYNRRRPLAWCQDVEFAVYGHLFQAGRNDWGTAGMGGNGQFNRLSALDDVADGAGPWRDRLTEDQDLGLRLTLRGWKGRQDLRATVSQQGLTRLRPLLRQRTRWSQGNLQALGLVRELATSPPGRTARIELLAYLLMPLWQGIIGVAFITAVTLMLLGIAPLWSSGPGWQLLLFYLLAFGGTILGCIAARRGSGARGWLLGFFTGNVYALYTWLLWPVLFRSVIRHLAHHNGWSKTRREPLEDEARALSADRSAASHGHA